MNVSVLGLWHLGPVTAACIAAAGHRVTAWDPDPAVVASLSRGQPPVAEPGLVELLARQLSEGRLRVETDLTQAIRLAEIVWVTFDTPVDDDDHADVESVVGQVLRAAPDVPDGAIVLFSSQLPVGTIRRIEAAYRKSRPTADISFACAPENLRLGRALEVFTNPDRVVLGTRTLAARERLSALFQPLTDRIEWMSIESAEMTKHAINTFLATSIVFINEIAAVAELVGADAREVERGLKTDRRIGPAAYLSPGGAFAGGTLARDVNFVRTLGDQFDRDTPLLDGVLKSNAEHQLWTRTRLQQELGEVAGKTIAVWGLTYKPGTDTLRRSESVALCIWLTQHGARVVVHDPVAGSLSDDLAQCERQQNPIDAARGAERTGDFDGVADLSRGRSQRTRECDDDQAGCGCQSISRKDAWLGQPFPTHLSGAAALTLSSRALEGRVAIITGASQGLGLAIARGYVEAGASVLMCARSASTLEQARSEVSALALSGQRVEAIPIDVSDIDDVSRLSAAALALFPQVHALVCNAGVYGPIGAIEEVDWQEWTRAMRINIDGSVLPCRALIPHFKKHGYGKIIQISGGGATNPLPRITAYAASKAAIVRFAESLALELQDFHVDVNAVAPGALNTRMLDEVLAAGPERAGRDFFDRMVKIKDQGGTPLGKGVTLAIYLASAESDGITGRLLSAVWDPWEELVEHQADLRSSDIYTLRRIVPGDRGRSWGSR